MKTKKIDLGYGWTVTMHKDCKLFLDVEEKNSYMLFDWDFDKMFNIKLEDGFYTLDDVYHGLKHKVDIENKNIILMNEPDEL